MRCFRRRPPAFSVAMLARSSMAASWRFTARPANTQKRKRIVPQVLAAAARAHHLNLLGHDSSLRDRRARVTRLRLPAARRHDAQDAVDNQQRFASCCTRRRKPLSAALGEQLHHSYRESSPPTPQMAKAGRHCRRLMCIGYWRQMNRGCASV
jgi:hypothetical protein